MIEHAYSHRGIFDNKQLFENSLAAFSKSVALGYGIELDVRLTKDHILVVFHDDNLERMFGEPIMIKDLTYAALRHYTYQGQPIPTLDAVLELVAGKVPLIIEIKNGHDNALICKRCALLLDDYEGTFSVESFDPFIMRWFKRNRPHYKRGLLIMGIHKYDHFIIGLAMRSFLFHAYVKPDFYAYHVDLGKNPLMRWFMQLMAKEIVLWTVKPDSKIYLNYDKKIFEDVRLV